MALTITGVVPTAVSTFGKTQVRITGTDLNTVTSVKFDSTEALSFTVMGPTLILATAPAHAAGAVGVTVQAGIGTPQTLASAVTYAVPSDVAPLTSTLARKFKVDVDMTPLTSATWRVVRAVTELKPPVVDPTMQDDSDYDSNGWGSDFATMLKWSSEITVGRKRDATEAQDTGQEQIRAASMLSGTDNRVHVRIYDRTGGPEAWEGWAAVKWEAQGGGTDALDTAKITLTGQGELVAIANPAA